MIDFVNIIILKSSLFCQLHPYSMPHVVLQIGYFYVLKKEYGDHGMLGFYPRDSEAVRILDFITCLIIYSIIYGMISMSLHQQ